MIFKYVMLISLFFSLNSFSSVRWKSHAQAEDGKVKVVEWVDLERYLGKWFEIARFEAIFQRGCDFVTANYSLNNDGSVRVDNRCLRVTGEEDEAIGRAWVVDKETNAKLKVRFFWPFSGDYWIIELDEDYEIAVVGTPDRKFLWILSRTPMIGSSLNDDILDRIQEQGFDLSKLRITKQNL